MAGSPRWGGWSIRAYRTEVDDLIDYVNNPPTFLFGSEDTYANVDEVRIDGLEVELSAQLRGWNTSVSYSWSEAIDQGTGDPLPNRAERTFRAGLDRSYGALRVGGSIEAQSERSGGQFSDPVPGYGIVNLHAGYRFSPAWRIRATMENVGDVSYRTTDQYRAPGRTTFVHLTYAAGGGV